MNKFKKGDHIKVLFVDNFSEDHGVKVGYFGIVQDSDTTPDVYFPKLQAVITLHEVQLELVNAVASSADLDFRDHQTKPAELTDEQYEKIGEEIARIFRLVPHNKLDSGKWLLRGGFGSKSSAGLAKVFFRLAEELRSGV